MPMKPSVRPSVNTDTDWVPGYVEAVDRLRGETKLHLRCGIEAKQLPPWEPYPGPVAHDAPSKEPVNLGPGWVGFDYAAVAARGH